MSARACAAALAQEDHIARGEPQLVVTVLVPGDPKIGELVFDIDETARRRDLASSSVKGYYDVAKSDRVVGRNERVTDEQETELLRNQAEALKRELDAIAQRLDELEKKE